MDGQMSPANPSLTTIQYQCGEIQISSADPQGPVVEPRKSRKPRGKWEKAWGVPYTKIEAMKETGMPRGVSVWKRFSGLSGTLIAEEKITAWIRQTRRPRKDGG